MKKICAITTIDMTLSSFVVDAMRALQQHEDVEVTLACSMSDDFYERHKDEFHCVNIPMCRGVNPLDIVKSTYAFYKLFKKEKFDYIQYATPNASLYASIAAKLVGVKKRVYCQWGIRYVGFQGRSRWLFKQLEKIICKLSTHVRSASQKNLDFAVSEGLYKAEKAGIIGNGGTIGVDNKQYDIAKKTELKASVLEQYPILNDKTVFGFVGRMDKDKGVNELFRAFFNVASNNPNMALLMIGPMDKADGINEALLKQAKESEQIIFSGYTKEVPKYMAAMDVLIHPSYREGFSMVIQQTMFMGVAILTTDIPGPSEVIEAGVSGLLVPARESVELTEKIEQLANDKVLRASLAEEGYFRASKLFNRQRMIELTVKDRIQILNS